MTVTITTANSARIVILKRLQYSIRRIIEFVTVSNDDVSQEDLSVINGSLSDIEGLAKFSPEKDKSKFIGWLHEAENQIGKGLNLDRSTEDRIESLRTADRHLEALVALAESWNKH